MRVADCSASSARSSKADASRASSRASMPGQLGLGRGLRRRRRPRSKRGSARALVGGLLDQGRDPRCAAPALALSGAGERVRLVQDADRRLGGDQLLHDVLAGQQQRGVARVVVPALPGGRVQHRRDAVRGRAVARPDRTRAAGGRPPRCPRRGRRRRRGVAVAARPAGGPHLVVDLAERVDAGELVAVAVADEDVLHGRHAQQVDVLADVRRVQRDPHRGQVQVHQVHPPGHADDRDRRWARASPGWRAHAG